MPEPARRTRRRARSLLRLALAGGLLVAMLPAAGCRAGVRSGLVAESLGEGRAVIAIPVRFAAHRAPDEVTTVVVVSDRTEDEIVGDAWTDGQVLEVEVLWRPRAGATPMDATATNVRLRHVVRAGGRTGVYEGAGFAMPTSGVGAERLKLDLRDATLRLIHADPGFRDLLTPSRITGGLSAPIDADATGRIERALDRIVRTTPRVPDPDAAAAAPAG